MSFRIEHRLIEQSAPAQERRGPQWRTCLREITFLEPHAAQGPHDLHGAEAYALVLEVICGLHSPITGETQVLGQFRAFLSSLGHAEQLWLGEIGNQLIHDARRVRERYLRGVSSGGYGGEVRRMLEGCEVIALLGRGSLASELRPYLEDCGRVVEWNREMTAAPDARAIDSGKAAVVVAAAVQNAVIEGVAARYADLRRVVDLRAADEREPLPFPFVTSLDDLFAAVEVSRMVSDGRMAGARAMIGELASAFGARQQVRPFGWEDLCA